MRAATSAQDEGERYPTGIDRSMETKFAARSTDLTPTGLP